jgi:hypothetical protein
MRDSREDQLAAGREALRRHAWHEAFEQLSAADAVEPLPPEDLELLAEAAMWVGRLDDCIAGEATGAVSASSLSFWATTTSPRARPRRRTDG